MTTLVLSYRHTADNQRLWRAAIARDWSVVRATGSKLPELEADSVALYLEALLAPLAAARLGVRLLTPPDDWLVQVPAALTQRRIEWKTLDEARALVVPTFVKPPTDKSFPAAVYASGAELPAEFDGAMLVLCAEPVEWIDEFRCFCLDGRVRAVSPYLRAGRLAADEGFACTEEETAAASQFAAEVVRATAATPRAVAIDVGRIRGRGWAVVEANAAWGAGIYGCDAGAVLDVIAAATEAP